MTGWISVTDWALWISGMERCRRPAEEMLLVGLGGEEAFGEKGCEMTESRPRLLLDLEPRSVR